MQKEDSRKDTLAELRTLIFSETFLIGLLTLAAYLSAFLFNLGYLTYFNIPYGLVDLPLTDVLCSVGIIALFFFLTTALSDKFLSKEETRINDFKKLLIFYIPLAFLFLLIGIGSNSLQGLYGILLLIIICLINSIVIFFGYKNNTEKRGWYLKTTKRKENQRSGQIFLLIKKILGPAYTAIIALTFIIVLLSFIAGQIIASSRSIFYTFTSQDESVAIVRFYNDRAIGVSYNPENGLFMSNFYSINFDSNVSDLLEFKKFGSIRVPSVIRNN